MNINQAFPSKWMKADVDVPEEGAVFTIEEVRFEMVGGGNDDEGEQKLVAYFQGTSKGLVLNRTNADVISSVLGSLDTDDWVGQSVTLYSTDVQFGSKMTRGIRVKRRRPGPGASPRQPAAPAPARQASPARVARPADPQPDDDQDEDIPFACPADVNPFAGETDNLFPRKRPIG